VALWHVLILRNDDTEATDQEAYDVCHQLGWGKPEGVEHGIWHVQPTPEEEATRGALFDNGGQIPDVVCEIGDSSYRIEIPN